MSTFIKAGKVPGTIVELQLNGTGHFTVLGVMKLAAQEIGRKKGLSDPAFEIRTGEYSGSSGNMIDVPQLNGRMLAEKVSDRWENIAWDTPVSDGDIVLVVPKIQGNQFTVKVGRIPGSFDEVCIYEASDEEGGDNAGTIKQALAAAAVKVAENDLIVVYDGEESFQADLDQKLQEGDEIFIHSAGYEFAPATIPTPSNSEVVAVSGTDPEKLNSEADIMIQNAESAEEEARKLLEKAASLKKEVAAHKAKAEAIETARADYEVAKARLSELGVFTRYSDDELTTMKRTELREVLRGYGLKSKATARKVDLIETINILQKVL